MALILTLDYSMKPTRSHGLLDLSETIATFQSTSLSHWNTLPRGTMEERAVPADVHGKERPTLVTLTGEGTNMNVGLFGRDFLIEGALKVTRSLE